MSLIFFKSWKFTWKLTLCVYLLYDLVVSSLSQQLCTGNYLYFSPYTAPLVSWRFSYLFSRVHVTLQPTLSVGRSEGWSHFTFFYDFISLTSLLLPKCGPCPTARNFHSRVSTIQPCSLKVLSKRIWNQNLYSKRTKHKWYEFQNSFLNKLDIVV